MNIRTDTILFDLSPDRVFRERVKYCGGDLGDRSNIGPSRRPKVVTGIERKDQYKANGPPCCRQVCRSCSREPKSPIHLTCPQHRSPVPNPGPDTTLRSDRQRFHDRPTSKQAVWISPSMVQRSITSTSRRMIGWWDQKRGDLTKSPESFLLPAA
jgi:hypothetical protein